MERIADEVKALFPQARTAIVTSDTLWSPARAAAFVRDVAGGAVDIIIGTQLVTKGYHFPELTLVGVIDAISGSTAAICARRNGPSSRSPRSPAAPAAARSPAASSSRPRAGEAPVIKALLNGDESAFYAAETASRRSANAPPFGRFAAIIVSDTDAALAQETARRIGKAAPQQEGLDVYGPAEAPLSVLRGRHRWRLLVHARRSVELQAIMRHWLSSIDWKASTRVSVDVDPYSFV